MSIIEFPSRKNEEEESEHSPKRSGHDKDKVTPIDRQIRIENEYDPSDPTIGDSGPNDRPENEE